MVFEKDQGQQSNEAPPKQERTAPVPPQNDMFTNFETELSTASILIHASVMEMPDVDHGLNLFKCLECGKIKVSILVFGNLKFMHSQHIMTFIESEKWPIERKCDCGRQMGPEDIIARAADMYFAEVKKHLQYRTYGVGQTRSYYGWYIWADTEFTPLGAWFDHDVMISAFGRVVNVKESWMTLLTRATQTGQIMSLAIDDGYYISVIPHTFQGNDIQLDYAVKANFDSLPKSKVLLLEHLSSLEKKGFPFYEETYHDWAGYYEQFLFGGYAGSTILIHVEKARAWLEWELKQRGKSFVIEPVKEPIYSVREGELMTKIHIIDIMTEGIHKAWTFPQIMKKAVDQAEGYFNIGKKFVEAVKERFPENRTRVIDNFLHIYHKGGKKLLNIEQLVEKIGYEGKAFDAQMKHLVGIFEGTATGLDVCHCGNIAYVSLLVKPSDFPSIETIPKEILNTEKDPRTSMLCYDYETYKMFFSLDCKDHSRFLMKQDLQEWGMTFQDLESRWYEDLDRNHFTIGAFYSYTDSDIIIAFIGHGVSNIIASATLILGALKKVNLNPNSSTVRVRCPHTDIVLITSDTTQDADIYNLERKAMVEHQNSFGPRGANLNIDMTVELEGDPVGQFEILVIKEI